MSNKIKALFHEHRFIILLIIFNVFLRFILYRPYPLIWDGATYILMGKYIFSFGQAGLFEANRPLVLPILLGAIWKLNLDPVLWGKILQFSMTLGSIVLVYLIGSKVYNKTVGIIAALLFSFSRAWYIYGIFILTEIPSVFFGLVAVYLYLKKRYFIAGWFAGFALMTKFTQLFTVFILHFIEGTKVVQRDYPNCIRNCLKLAVGSAVLIAIYLIFNWIMYKDLLTPYADARMIYPSFTGKWIEGILRCLVAIIKIENWILLMVPVSLFFTLKKEPTNRNKMIIVALGLIHFFWVGKMLTDTTRFITSCLPYLYIMAADGILQIFGHFKSQKRVLDVFLAALIVLTVFVQMNKLTAKSYYPGNEINFFQKYVLDNEKTIKGKIWISDPNSFAYSSLGITEQIYYPIFNKERIVFLRSKIDEPDYIFWDSYNLKCFPVDDPECLEERMELFDHIKKTFDQEHYYEHPSGAYFVGIFKRNRH